MAVCVIRALALEKIDISFIRTSFMKDDFKAQYTIFSLLKRELTIGMGVSLLLCFVGYFRVMWFLDDDVSTDMAKVVCLSLFLIVITSVAVGFSLPFILLFFSLDPAHAGPAVQVVMDIFGVGCSSLFIFVWRIDFIS